MPFYYSRSSDHGGYIRRSHFRPIGAGCVCRVCLIDLGTHGHPPPNLDSNLELDIAFHVPGADFLAGLAELVIKIIISIQSYIHLSQVYFVSVRCTVQCHLSPPFPFLPFSTASADEMFSRVLMALFV